MGDELDYQRLGRQIALPEVGPEGQRRLASTRVRFVLGDGDRSSVTHWVATQLHARAGGASARDAEPSPVLTLAVPAVVGPQDPATLGVGAFYAVEAARRVLGQPPVELPAALRERLTIPRQPSAK